MIDLEAIKREWDYDSNHPIWAIVKELVEEDESLRSALADARAALVTARERLQEVRRA